MCALQAIVKHVKIKSNQCKEYSFLGYIKIKPNQTKKPQHNKPPHTTTKKQSHIHYRSMKKTGTKLGMCIGEQENAYTMNTAENIICKNALAKPLTECMEIVSLFQACSRICFLQDTACIHIHLERICIIKSHKPFLVHIVFKVFSVQRPWMQGRGVQNTETLCICEILFILRYPLIPDRCSNCTLHL